MAKHISLFFYGQGEGPNGLPDPFHRYEVYVSDWHDGGGVATVVVSTLGAPSPECLTFVSKKGRKQALKLAVDALRSLNPDLERHRG